MQGEAVLILRALRGDRVSKDGKGLRGGTERRSADHGRNDRRDGRY
jgi:hypothetical protein